MDMDVAPKCETENEIVEMTLAGNEMAVDGRMMRWTMRTTIVMTREMPSKHVQFAEYRYFPR
jgi:hypothetical protein